ncbi:MAG TPA: bifunctional hydroxymethylpyrimidine kinase/phosphomethylpyrimidine kinase [Thermoanaerobaculia bacterium]|nr:bifunctional hydroxymethylpyrimidine kinase/phosphomethylpyrimidine kinase [Thermoanaerobaculia bacterium]
MKTTRNRPVSAVTIAMSDSAGGAGIQADLLTFAAHGVHAASVLVAATAQSTLRITGIEPLSPAFIRRQMDAVFPDIRPAAVKIGALYDAARIRVVAAGLARHRAKNVVLDPVLAAKAGASLLAPSAISSLLEELFPHCDLVTPNLPEAEALAGIRIRDSADKREAARVLASFGCRAVLIKGGHAKGREVTDLFYDGHRFREISHPRIRTRATHGTGCTLSAAIAANLALGHGLESSVRRAIRYLGAGLERGIFPGRGWGVPDHFPGRRRS